MKKKTLAAELWGFLHAVLSDIYTYKKSGKMPLNSRIHVRKKVNQFSNVKGRIGYISQDEYIVKTEWDMKDHHDFTEKLLSANGNYKTLFSQIGKKYGVAENQAEYWLRKLVDVITRKEEYLPSDETIVDYISVFIADLEKTPLNWYIEVWVNGFWVKDSTSIKVNDEISIRQVAAKDLEVERAFDSSPFEGVFGNHAAAIVEINMRSKNQNEVHNHIQTLLNALRLFRLGSVEYVKYSMVVDSIINFGGSSGRNQVGGAYRYELQSTDKDDLTSIIGLIFTKNRAIKIFDAQPDVTNSIGIALKRYNNALLKSDTDEERIASVVSCLEALYMKSRERSELSHRLSQRAAILLKQFNMRPKKIYDDLDRAYLIRSIYSHGSFVNPDEHKDITDLTYRVLEYARVSLLTFIQLNGTTEKESLINKLENAMLEENALTTLKELIEKCCKCYK